MLSAAWLTCGLRSEFGQKKAALAGPARRRSCMVETGEFLYCSEGGMMAVLIPNPGGATHRGERPGHSHMLPICLDDLIREALRQQPVPSRVWMQPVRHQFCEHLTVGIVADAQRLGDEVRSGLTRRLGSHTRVQVAKAAEIPVAHAAALAARVCPCVKAVAAVDESHAILVGMREAANSGCDERVDAIDRRAERHERLA
eukprot:CAMPEP_0115877456 /NCGR_PEP_ID=MMETSP0287-20121206/26234_1 /TAXON_ID=412157 /ORGANISM="Chrysochromulina rotalis, Strain UIO044" /LENGTH=199 /DNA_ID=CAMNT_0003332975 /DNA_START=197 /DNA_END=793 /DNA_ORIENTATION=+